MASRHGIEDIEADRMETEQNSREEKHLFLSPHTRSWSDTLFSTPSVYPHGNVQPESEPPIFIPDFTALRQNVSEATEVELRNIELELDTIEDDPQRDRALTRARKLLQELDMQIEARLRLQQIEEPAYLSGRDLSIVKFAVDQGRQKWTMLHSPTGRECRSIFQELNTSKEPSRGTDILKHLETFGAKRSTAPLDIALKRAKQVVERRPGVVSQGAIGGPYVARPSIVITWYIAIAFACLSWIGFFAVGIIATNTTFSPLFIRYFYWIAVIWTLIPSFLLCWLVQVFGGSPRDITSAFLASLAIFLVMIQYGQSHLTLQLSQMQQS